MGIKNLKVIINSHCKNAINYRKYECYRGIKVAIDLSIFLYKYLYNNNDHLEGLTRLILKLLKYQIIPVFVFDGEPPEEKNNTLQERKEKKEILNIRKNVYESCSKLELENNTFEEFKEKIDKMMKTDKFVFDDVELNLMFNKSKDELINEADKIKRKIIYVNQSHIDSSKKLFDLFGIQYIHEECEAEGLMSVLCKRGIVQACMSEDMDTLPCGTTMLWKSVSTDKAGLEEYCLEGILNGLELTQDEFIDVCILCGCDYTEKINAIGPVNALKIIKKYKNIEAFLEDNTKYTIPENFINNFQRARYLFNNPISDEIYEKINKDIKCNKPNIVDLIEFLKKTSLKNKYFQEIETELINYYLNIEGIYMMDTSVSSPTKKTKKQKPQFKNYIKNKDNSSSKMITDFFKVI